MKRVVMTGILGCLALMLLCGCAMQQDVVTLDDRLAAIEQRNAENAKRIDEYQKAQQDLREQYAGQNIFIRDLRDEIQQINGRLEETEYLLEHKLNSFKDSNDKQAQQLDKIEQILVSNQNRIKNIERYLNLEIKESDLKGKVEPGSVSEVQSEKNLGEDEAYRLAKLTFDQGNFEAAREKFQKLVTQYPKTKYADNAQFWIGETYYREKRYKKAILEYQKVIEKYPEGSKVQASFLKQGLAFLNLKDKANARLILTELVKKFPKSNEARIAKKRLKEL